MIDKLEAVEARYDELLALIADPAVQADAAKYREHAKAISDLEPLIEKYREFKSVDRQIQEAQELARGGDAEMAALAREELRTLEPRRESLLEELKVLLLPKDPNDEKNVILEIRAGTGGDEAALFAAELFRMYRRFCERRGWPGGRGSVIEGRVSAPLAREGGLAGVRACAGRCAGTGV